MGTKVRYLLSESARKNAIVLSGEDPGRELFLDMGELSPEQRAELSPHLQHKQAEGRESWVACVTPTYGSPAIMANGVGVEHVLAEVRRHKTNEAESLARIAAEDKDKIAKWYDEMRASPAVYCYAILTPHDDEDRQKAEWVMSETEARKQAADARRKAEKQAEDEQHAAEVAEHGRQKAALCQAWLDTLATDIQAEKELAGMLPAAERYNSISDYLFGAIGLPPYQRLTGADVEHAEECAGRPVRYCSEDASCASDEEWLALKHASERVNNVIAELLSDDSSLLSKAGVSIGTDIKLRRHRGECEDCGAVVTRPSIMVCIAIGGHKFKRALTADRGQTDE